MKQLILRSLSTLIIAGFHSAVLASTHASWEAYRENLKIECKKVIANKLINPKIIVDSTGTESYGIGLAIGATSYSTKPHAIVCVYNERTKKIELSSPLPI